MRDLLIMIPTYNRPDSIKFYIEKVLNSLIEYSVDLIICDSSTDDKTKEIVSSYIDNADRHLLYQRFDSDLYEEKIYQAVTMVKDDYNYLWMCSDSYVLNITELYPTVSKCIYDDIDIIHIDELDQDKLGDREYYDCKELFRECFVRMTLYCSTIVHRRVFDTVLNRTIYDKYTGSGFYYQSSLMEYCAINNFKAIRIYNKNHYTINQHKTKSEWAGRAVWQWSKNWYTVIQRLPDVYNECKTEVLKKTDMFSLSGLIRLRYFGGLTLKEVHKYKDYIKVTSRSNIVLVYLMCLVPTSMIILPRKIYRCIKSTWKHV